MKIEIEIDDRVAQLIGCLIVSHRYTEELKSKPLAERVRVVINELIDHAQQGVYRPGSWERDWINQVFPDEWQSALEPGDPYGRKSCDAYFCKPKEGA